MNKLKRLQESYISNAVLLDIGNWGYKTIR